MSITAADVNKLRQQTGAGMMDCKNALTEAEGDFEKAVEILRKKGQKVAAKRGDRETAEGLVMATTASNDTKGILLAVNCETDFVAKNSDFGDFANQILSVAVENTPANGDDLKALPYNGNGVSIGEMITEQIGKIGEKIDINYQILEADTVVAYNHPGNQLASIVGLNKTGDNVIETGKAMAMQVAAMAPIALDQDSVEQSIIDKEIEIGKDLAIQEGKPAEMAEKIAMGRLNKFFKESTLLNQEFVRDGKKTVKQVLQETEDGLTVTDFKRFAFK